MVNLYVGQGIYPYSLASAGKIEAEHVEVFGLPAGEYSSLGPGQTLDIADEDKEPSHIVSNSSAGGSEKAVLLGVDTKIAGDVKASGEIEVDPGAQVQGLVLPGSDAQNLPNVTVENFDPAGKDGVYPWSNTPPPGKPNPLLTGRARHQGNLTIGNLDMAEGLLYVDGDVTITGTVKGKGAIVATGKITVTGSMDTQADHAALVAKKDIKIHGNGPNSSKFQGLIYSEKSIDIARTTIMGAAVSKDTAGTTKLEEVKAISVPELTKIEFEIHSTLEETKDGMVRAATGLDDEPTGVEFEGAFIEFNDANTDRLKEVAAALSRDGTLDWKIIMRGSPDLVVGPPLNTGAPRDAKRAFNSWLDYVNEHKEARIKTREIFTLDLNTLISLDVELEMMYHTTVNSRGN